MALQILLKRHKKYHILEYIFGVFGFALIILSLVPLLNLQSLDLTIDVILATSFTLEFLSLAFLLIANNFEKRKLKFSFLIKQAIDNVKFSKNTIGSNDNAENLKHLAKEFFFTFHK